MLRSDKEAGQRSCVFGFFEIRLSAFPLQTDIRVGKGSGQTPRLHDMDRSRTGADGCCR